MKAGSRRLLPLVVGTIGLVGCAALVVTLTYIHNVRVDLSPQRGYTLSRHARNILEQLDRDVRLTVFVRSADARTPRLKDLLWRVRNANPRVSYEFVDLNRSPALARQYDVDRYGAVIVESDGGRRDVTNPSEGSLMSAILAVTRNEERVAYFITGHGEYSPESTDRKTGYSTVKIALEEDLFTVRELPLIGDEGIPRDARLVVSAGARKDYLPNEIAALEAYLARGGNLLLLLDPESPPNLVALAERLGIRPEPRVVVDPEGRLAAGEGVTVLVSGLDQSLLVSRALEAPPVFSYARPLQVSGSAMKFLETSASSYAAAPDALRAGPQGARGPQVVGAALLPRAAADGVAAHGRIIVYGDADFATNGVIDYLGNKDLFVNSANWLVRADDLIAARAQRKEPGREQFFVTAGQGAMAFWLAAVVQPAAFLAAGVFVYLRRRWS
jgi:ABC-type uncharacterized transport system involved in gliding motility auxiliary subunit